MFTSFRSKCGITNIQDFAESIEQRVELSSGTDVNVWITSSHEDCTVLTRVRMDVKAFPSLCLSQIVSFINTSDAEDEDKDLDRTVFAVTFPSCPSVLWIRHPMKLVPFESVFTWTSRRFLAVPVCLCLSQIHKEGIRYCPTCVAVKTRAAS
ncbi:hypothetical protein T03_7689 [Trichinella britovi]|uniref:Uncharacterized protein n=1 Tax=Trichinella britovi TaxID=45882 RepID=A0A0V1D1S9_TRIBR|nr:hypothetical protein T03_7689 [Trichinella britovi]